jgi:hypothetical protein
MLSQAMMSWAKPQRTRAQKLRRFGLGFVAYIILVAAIVALLQAQVLSDEMLLGAAAGTVMTFLLWAAVHWYSTRGLMALAHGALARHGPVEVVLCADYIDISSQLSKGRMDWLCVDGVDRIADATVLRVGGVVYAMPDTALPAGVTPDTFYTDLTAWKEAPR